MSCDYFYALTPFVAWLLRGCSKFAINSLEAKRFAFDLIGYGGMPINHRAIACSMAVLIGHRESVAHPDFGGRSVRRETSRSLRERMSYSRSEILAGWYS